jgi:hypothetical protein
MRSEIKARFLSFFGEAIEPGVCSRKWHALAYYDHKRRRCIMVAWPLHYVVRGFRWLEWKWDTYRHRPGWIDRHIAAAIDRDEYPRRSRY